MNPNPVLNELQTLSPPAQQALVQAHQMAAPITAGQAGGPSIQAHTPVTQDAGQAPAPASITHPMMNSEVPSIGGGQSPQVAHSSLIDHQNELNRVVGSGSGISQIGSKIEGLMPNHPILGKILGIGAQGLATLGNVGLDAVAPEVSAALPGTDYHHDRLVRQDQRQVAGDEANAEKEAQTQAMGATTARTNAETAALPAGEADKHNLTTAQIGNLTSEADERGNQKDDWKELAGYSGPNGEPLEINSANGQTRVAQSPGAKPRTANKESNPAEQTYDSLIKSGMTPMQAYEKIREKPGGTTINQGTWSLEEQNGKPVLFNSKTGQVQAAPDGLAKTGTAAKAEALTAPAQQALEYAKDYGARAVHTGAGDEALMEKYFELAKPSTGFRMSQPQIDMLKNAQSWMGGLEAHLRHATTGTWFSDDQRKEITDTMSDLASANGMKSGSSSPSTGGSASTPARPQGVPANAVWNAQGNNGSGSWRIP